MCVGERRKGSGQLLDFGIQQFEVWGFLCITAFLPEEPIDSKNREIKFTLWIGKQQSCHFPCLWFRSPAPHSPKIVLEPPCGHGWYCQWPRILRPLEPGQELTCSETFSTTLKIIWKAFLSQKHSNILYVKVKVFFIQKVMTPLEATTILFQRLLTHGQPCFSYTLPPSPTGLFWSKSQTSPNSSVQAEDIFTPILSSLADLIIKLT